jgi:hypothetical protein
MTMNQEIPIYQSAWQQNVFLVYPSEAWYSFYTYQFPSLRQGSMLLNYPFSKHITTQCDLHNMQGCVESLN